MRVFIDVIPHHLQRYDTVGDWKFVRDSLFITVSEMGDWKKEMVVAHHELTEALICKSDGITEKRVNDYDMGFEARRALADHQDFTATCGCYHEPLDEPGDDPHAPYYRQHQVATGMERILVNELELSWGEYEHACNSLEYTQKCPVPTPQE